MKTVVTFLLGGALMFLSGGTVICAQDLEKELRQLDSLRKGPKTPFAQVEERAMELLKIYPDPKAHGLIYYQLAHIHAQSGMVRPGRVIEYATKAMEYPLDLSQRLRLYVYWGDAVQVRKEAFADRRKAALNPYLLGLKEVAKLKLPDQPPELPGVHKYDADGSPEDIAAAKKEHHAALEARKQALMQRQLVMHRDVLTNQIVGLYTRKPYASAELEREASDILQDPQMVSKLVNKVREKTGDAEPRVAKQSPAKAPASPLKAPAGGDRYAIWLIVAGAVVLALVTFFLLRSRLIKRGKNGAP